MSDVSGVLNLYKERGVSSFKATDRVRKLFNVKKAGHGGTLDPEAEGVLPVFLGMATRISALFLNARKEYRVVFLFGISTDTFDMAGNVTGRKEEFSLPEKELIDVLRSFEGSYMQTPPRFSAVKVKGRRAYDLARKGVDFELEPRSVTCEKVDCLHFDGREAEVLIGCESGFYIRSMARDLADRIHIPVTTKNIIREKVGFLHRSSSYTIGELEKMKRGGNEGSAVLTIDDALPDLPGMCVDERGERMVVKGTKPDLFLPSGSPPGRYKIKNQGGRVIALVEKTRGGGLKYMCVFP